ncbi:HD domain-containing protein [Alicyclobacillus fodiniaquatilis]|jgi:putative hydrolase of HD superfamily|uniref:HD family hydrolase n=1 Tax=Alicyclobacillus fodiniaquatilis TaxID=1661150 RepID=A0ABW4JGA9_9BACL
MENRIEQIVNFLTVLDGFKTIARRTIVGNTTRHENDAEHTWHMCMFALLLHREMEHEVNLERALQLILIHDLVEIYAGDTFAYDTQARIGKKEREELAAKRLFGQLPPDLTAQFHALWDEFEAGLSAEAQFANAIDSIQAFAQNVNTKGHVWKTHRIPASRVMEKNKSWIQQSKAFSTLYDYLWQKAEQESSFYREE